MEFPVARKLRCVRVVQRNFGVFQMDLEFRFGNNSDHESNHFLGIANGGLSRNGFVQLCGISTRFARVLSFENFGKSIYMGEIQVLADND